MHAREINFFQLQSRSLIDLPGRSKIGDSYFRFFFLLFKGGQVSGGSSEENRTPRRVMKNLSLIPTKLPIELSVTRTDD